MPQKTIKHHLLQQKVSEKVGVDALQLGNWLLCHSYTAVCEYGCQLIKDLQSYPENKQTKKQTNQQTVLTVQR